MVEIPFLMELSAELSPLGKNIFIGVLRSQ